jgi:hypothetical protein
MQIGVKDARDVTSQSIGLGNYRKPVLDGQLHLRWCSSLALVEPLAIGRPGFIARDGEDGPSHSNCNLTALSVHGPVCDVREAR